MGTKVLAFSSRCEATQEPEKSLVPAGFKQSSGSTRGQGSVGGALLSWEPEVQATRLRAELRDGEGLVVTTADRDVHLQGR